MERRELIQRTYMGFNLNAALDAGVCNHITIAMVKEQLRNGTIFEFLERELGEYIDLGLLNNEDRAELLSEWAELADNVDEGRKMGVTQNGICLLMAYVLEGIQRVTR